MSYSQTTTEMQDQVLDAWLGQDAVVVAVKSVADGVAPITNLLPVSSYTDKLPNAAEVIDSTFGFAQKLRANQKDFATKLIEASGLSTTVAKPGPKTAKAA